MHPSLNFVPNMAQARPALRVDSPMLCRALFEVFLGQDSIVPDARATWAAGARNLLSSEQVRPYQSQTLNKTLTQHINPYLEP